MHDVIIIGGGPAGLAAGIYAVRRGLTTLIIEKKMPGGQLLTIKEIENYPGFGVILGEELAARMTEQAKRLGVEIVMDEAMEMELHGEVKTIKAHDKEYAAKAVILAMGGEYTRLGVKGERKLTGRGVSFCATCDGPFFKNRVIAVVGGGNKAVGDALYMSEIAKKTYLIHRRDTLRAEETNQEKLKEHGVELLLDTVIEEIVGGPLVTSIKTKNVKTGKVHELPVDGVFVSIGVLPKTEVEEKAGVAVSEKGFIKVDRDQQTNISGVFAAGDVTGGVMQITTAVGDGCVAALSAYSYIKKPDWKRK
jgi:thioredoxin reductase (NADPH)